MRTATVDAMVNREHGANPLYASHERLSLYSVAAACNYQIIAHTVRASSQSTGNDMIISSRTLGTPAYLASVYLTHRLAADTVVLKLTDKVIASRNRTEIRHSAYFRGSRETIENCDARRTARSTANPCPSRHSDGDVTPSSSITVRVHGEAGFLLGEERQDREDLRQDGGEEEGDVGYEAEASEVGVEGEEGGEKGDCGDEEEGEAQRGRWASE
nr:hypothetical protein Iba_chr11bCG14060 [Ipomoea batatas]